MKAHKGDRARWESALVCPHCGGGHFVRVQAEDIVRAFLTADFDGMQEEVLSAAAWKGYACSRYDRLISVRDLVEEG